jgi:hypothetical protein
MFDAFDLKDILTALGDRVAGWQWWIEPNSEVKSTGAEHADPSVEAIWRILLDLGNWGQRQGMWLSGQDLERFARTILQTIDGTFQAFSLTLDPNEVALEEVWAPLRQGRAELISDIQDGCVFEVSAKHAQDIARLRTRYAEMGLEYKTDAC